EASPSRSRPLAGGGWGKVTSGEVTLAAVAEDGDDALAGAHALGDFEGGVDVGARGGADQEAFLPGEAAEHAVGRQVGHRHDLVDQAAIEHRRDEARAEALDGVEARAAAREDGAGARLDGDDAHVRPALLQEPADAGD